MSHFIIKKKNLKNSCRLFTLVLFEVLYAFKINYFMLLVLVLSIHTCIA